VVKNTGHIKVGQYWRLPNCTLTSCFVSSWYWL